MITIFPNTLQAQTFTPSELHWSLNDVSQAESGRDMSGTMYKNTVTKKRKLEMKFNGLSWADTSRILTAFDQAEYFPVEYPDMRTGQMEIRTFYRGDMESDAYIWWDDRQYNASVSFNIIER